jgi:hypothetical protein
MILRLIGMTTLAAGALLVLACSDAKRDNVDMFFAYREARLNKDIDSALSFFADTAKFTFEGLPEQRTIQDTRRRMGWDITMDARTEFRDLRTSGDSLTLTMRETNDFYRALDIPYREYMVTYVYNENGKIALQYLVPLPYEGKATGEALRPFLAWARENAPGRLAKAYADRRIIFTPESARVWKELFAEWQVEGERASSEGGQ